MRNLVNVYIKNVKNYDLYILESTKMRKMEVPKMNSCLIVYLYQYEWIGRYIFIRVNRRRKIHKLYAWFEVTKIINSTTCFSLQKHNALCVTLSQFFHSHPIPIFQPLGKTTQAHCSKTHSLSQLQRNWNNRLFAVGKSTQKQCELPALFGPSPKFLSNAFEFLGQDV